MKNILNCYNELSEFLGEDLYVPFQRKIREIIADTIKSTPNKSRIIIRCGGGYTQKFLAEFELKEKNIIAIADRQKNYNQIYGYPVVSADEIEALHPDYIIKRNFKRVRNFKCNYNRFLSDSF